MRRNPGANGSMRPVVVVAAAVVALVASLEVQGQEHHKLVYERPAEASDYTQQLRIDVGDVPGHQVRVYELRTVYRDEALRFLGVPVVEEWNRAFSDYTNASGRHFGYCMYVLKTGEQIHCRLDGSTRVTPEGAATGRTTFSGITTLTGGTGRFVGIRGLLRYTGFFDPAQNRSGDRSEGEYWIQE